MIIRNLLVCGIGNQERKVHVRFVQDIQGLNLLPTAFHHVISTGFQ